MKARTGALADWTEDEGTPLARRALVHTGPMGTFVAYVGVPADNSLAGRGYDDMPLECHGGLTFASEGGSYPWPSGWYWWGWDYAHGGDFMAFVPKMGGHQWTLEEVEAEARAVMDQLRDLLADVMPD